MGAEGASNFGLDILDQHLPWRIALENVQNTQEFLFKIFLTLSLLKSFIEILYSGWENVSFNDSPISDQPRVAKLRAH